MNPALALMMLSGAVLPSQWQHWAHTGSVSDLVCTGSTVTCATSGGVLFGTITGGDLAWDSSWVYPGDISHSSVRCVEHSADGSLWVGTWGGGIDVRLPDGSMQHYGQLEGLPIDLEIGDILADSAVFAATSQGLSIMEMGYFQTWTGLNTGGALPDDFVNCLVSSDSGLLVGTADGLALLKPGMWPGDPASWTAFPEMNGISTRDMDLQADTVWAATDAGLYYLAPGQPWLRDAGFPGEGALCVSAHDGNIAVGSGWIVHIRYEGSWQGSAIWGGQLVKALDWAGGQQICAGMSNELSTQDDTGRGVGLGWTYAWKVSTPPGIPANHLWSVTLDDGGSAWVTTDHAGAAVLADGAWTVFIDSLPNEHQVFAGAGDVEGAAFIAPYHFGLVWLDWGGTPGPADDLLIEWTEEGGGLLNDQVVAIDIAPSGEVWLGQEPYFATPTEPSGACRLSWVAGVPGSASWMSWTTADGLPSGMVNAVAGLSDGSGWIGTDAGLVRVGPGQGMVSQVLGTSQGLPSEEVTELLAARSGRLYVGTANGLAVLEDGASSAGGISDVEGAVTALAEDHMGSVWAATGQALYRILHDGSIEEYNTLNSPMLSQIVHSISCDRDRGLLYLATDNGMWMIDLGNGLAGDGGGAVLFPNPFLPGAGDVLGLAGIPDAATWIEVFDLSGRLVYECASPDRDGISWDGEDEGGDGAASGIYVVRVTQDGYETVLKLALVR